MTAWLSVSKYQYTDFNDNAFMIYIGIFTDKRLVNIVVLLIIGKSVPKVLICFSISLTMASVKKYR